MLGNFAAMVLYMILSWGVVIGLGYMVWTAVKHRKDGTEWEADVAHRRTFTWIILIVMAFIFLN